MGRTSKKGYDMNLLDVKEQIKEELKKHPVILYMKGSKEEPRCGFSAQVVEILDALKVDYVTRDVLENDYLRQAIKEHSNWPTLPQLYIKEEFIGGCDIITQLHEQGELKQLFEAL